MGSIVWVPVIFSASTILLYVVSVSLPSSGTVESNMYNETLKFPSNLEELSSLATFLSAYKEKHSSYVLILFALAYLWKQTFAVPGSVFLNLLAGALFGTWIGFPLACSLTALGATNCYLLSKYFGKEYILKYFPDRINPVQAKIEENTDSLFFFLLFLRLFPMSPNWFMNMVAPILNVPVHLFFLSVFIGLMPYNFICVQTGCFLSQLKSMDDVLSIWTLLKLLGFANIALIPALVIKYYHNQKQIKKKIEEAERVLREKEEEIRRIEDEARVERRIRKAQQEAELRKLEEEEAILRQKMQKEVEERRKRQKEEEERMRQKLRDEAKRLQEAQIAWQKAKEAARIQELADEKERIAKEEAQSKEKFVAKDNDDAEKEQINAAKDNEKEVSIESEIHQTEHDDSQELEQKSLNLKAEKTTENKLEEAQTKEKIVAKENDGAEKELIDAAKDNEKEVSIESEIHQTEHDYSQELEQKSLNLKTEKTMENKLEDERQLNSRMKGDNEQSAGEHKLEYDVKCLEGDIDSSSCSEIEVSPKGEPSSRIDKGDQSLPKSLSEKSVELSEEDRKADREDQKLKTLQETECSIKDTIENETEEFPKHLQEDENTASISNNKSEFELEKMKDEEKGNLSRDFSIENSITLANEDTGPSLSDENTELLQQELDEIKVSNIESL